MTKWLLGKQENFVKELLMIVLIGFKCMIFVLFRDSDIQIMESMQIEQSECFLQLPIDRYHNRAYKNPLKTTKKQMIFVRKGCFYICFQDTPQIAEDTVSYDKIRKVDCFQKTKPHSESYTVVAVLLKTDERPSISFRVGSKQQGKQLSELLIDKIRQFNNLPDFTDLLLHKEQIINRIKETQPEYRDIFRAFSHKIPVNKLKAVLFGGHKLMTEYMSAAIAKGFDIDREFMLAEIKEKPRPRPPVTEITEALQKYDIAKSLQGLRFHDDQKKLKFVPSADDVDDDFFFSCLPKQEEPDITQTFKEVVLEKMEGEGSEEEVKLKVEEEDVTFARPVNVQRPVKGKYLIYQPKQIFDRPYGKSDKSKESRSDLNLNVDTAKRVTLILKLFYRLIKYKDTTSEEISAIENELHRLMNTEPKPAPYLNDAISKATKNILKWKRENSAYNR